jgi:hypothetical protein
MNPSNTPESRPTRAELAAQLSEELIRLRDALVMLSINLKDWQFEMDQNGKRVSQKILNEVMDKCRLQRPNDSNSSEISRPSASQG